MSKNDRVWDKEENVWVWGKGCSAQIWPDGGGHYPCHYRATVARDGKPFCLKHDPERLRARYEARQTRRGHDKIWRKGERERQKREHEAHEPMLNALKLMVDITMKPGVTDIQIAEAVVKAREAIAKAEHG